MIPRNEKIFWLKEHCAPGTLDPETICTLCNQTRRNCAKSTTQLIKSHHILGCGGSGFWCPKCGVFYPQDSCGEVFHDEWETASGRRVRMENNKIFCNCGYFLYAIPGE